MFHAGSVDFVVGTCCSRSRRMLRQGVKPPLRPQRVPSAAARLRSPGPFDESERAWDLRTLCIPLKSSFTLHSAKHPTAFHTPPPGHSASIHNLRMRPPYNVVKGRQFRLGSVVVNSFRSCVALYHALWGQLVLANACQWCSKPLEAVWLSNCLAVE